MGEIVNKTRLAAVLGKSERALTDWQKLGMPIEKTGVRGQSNTYNTEKVIDWMIKRATDTNGEMEKAKLRLILAQARNAELDAEEKEGSLISLDNMKGLWGNVLAAFRAKILSMPNRLTPLITTHRDPKKIEKILKDACTEALNELAEYDLEPHKERKASRKGSAKDSSSTAAS